VADVVVLEGVVAVVAGAVVAVAVVVGVEATGAGRVVALEVVEEPPLLPQPASAMTNATQIAARSGIRIGAVCQRAADRAPTCGSILTIG